MKAKLTTGVFFLLKPNCNGSSPDYSSLAIKLAKLEGVITFPPLNGEKPDADKWANDFRRLGIERLVLCGEKPGFIKSFFSRALVMAGQNPLSISLVDLSTNGQDKRRNDLLNSAALLGAIKGVGIDELNGQEYPVNELSLVIGAGIAGIQAALEIADAGRKVYLLEKSATIGGHMAMFDKTFPTLDCAACILTPKMVEVGQHPNIELLTYSELVSVEGEPGNFIARITKKARRVDISKCIGCGTCAEKCPSKVESEFDAGTSLRKAIYIPFPQAVPNKYLIDAEHCTYVESGKCGVCAKVCPVDDCVLLDQQDETIDINIGNIIVSTGFKVFDPKPLLQYGYGEYPNVITSLELERLVNASGPTGGNITFRTQDKKGNWIFDEANSGSPPESYAIIHCIGSRDINNNKYCSRVCCMYSLKLAHLIKEKFPEAPVHEFYIDMRAFGKGYEEFYERIRSEGVNMIRGKTAKITQKGDKLILRSEDILSDRLIETEVDMVVLSVGMVPEESTHRLASMLNLQLDNNGWLGDKNYTGDPVSSDIPGIYIAGSCQGPKDIPDSVAQASAAASRVLKNILRGSVHGNISMLGNDSIKERVEELMIIDK